jgi:hypothetical protein
MQLPCRYDDELGRSSGKTSPDAELSAFRTVCFSSKRARSTDPAADDRIDDDAVAHAPVRTSRFANGPGDLVAGLQWVSRVALGEVGHQAREELEVGAAEADPGRRDEGVVVARNRGVDLVDGSGTRVVQTKRLHKRAECSRSLAC